MTLQEWADQQKLEFPRDLNKLAGHQVKIITGYSFPHPPGITKAGVLARAHWEGDQRVIVRVGEHSYYLYELELLDQLENEL